MQIFKVNLLAIGDKNKFELIKLITKKLKDMDYKLMINNKNIENIIILIEKEIIFIAKKCLLAKKYCG